MKCTRQMGLILLAIMLIASASSHAQRLSVRQFEHDAVATDAVKFPVRDANGQPAALLKVRLEHFALCFEGNVLKTEYKGSGEYWVYMSAGSRFLTISSTLTAPLEYEFEQPLQGNRTYILQLRYHTSGDSFKVLKAQPRATTDGYKWPRRSFITFDYAFPNSAFGLTFGGGKKWGYLFGMAIGVKGQQTMVYDYWTDGSIMRENQKFDFLYNYHFLFGITRRLNADCILRGGLGFALGGSEEFPGGMLLDLGVMMDVHNVGVISLSYELVNGEKGSYSMLKLGIGFGWDSYF